MVLQGLIEFPKTRDECDTVSKRCRGQFWPSGEQMQFNLLRSFTARMLCSHCGKCNQMLPANRWFILYRLFDSAPSAHFVNGGTVKQKPANQLWCVWIKCALCLLVFLSGRHEGSCWEVTVSREEAVVFWAEIKCISRPLNIQFFLTCKENKEPASWGVRKTSRWVRTAQEELPESCAPG